MNPHKGDMPFTVEGKEYILQYRHSALVMLERQLGKGILKILHEMDAWRTNPEDMRLETVCALLWAGLQKHHPGLTLEQATAIFDDAEGGAIGLLATIGEAFQRGFNAPETKGANPQSRGVNGIGTNSGSNTPASDTSPMSSGTSLPAS